MIIFGGQNGSTSTPPTFHDVWVLSHANGLGGTPTWTQLNPTGGPPAGQSIMSAVYDAANNRMIVFGGGLTNGGGISNAVWLLSNANGQGGAPVWTNLVAEGVAGSPPARQSHTAVYDQSSNRMMIFGGSGTATHYNDAWLLANANGLGGTPTWTQITPTGGPPAARSGHGAVFNPSSDRLTVYGGFNSTGNLTDTWVLTNANGVTGPVVGLLPTPVTFPPQGIGTTSPPQTVTLSNTGGSALTITSIACSGDFFCPTPASTCGSSVSAGGSCVIDVTFTPTVTGARTGTLTVTDNAGNSPQTVTLNGTGVAPPVVLNPTNLTFPNQNVGTTSAAQTVTLTNNGTVALTISSSVISSNYAQTNTCGNTVSAGGSCTYSVTFTPTATGTIPGTLTIHDNASNNPQIVNLMGTGTGQDFTVVIAPGTSPSLTLARGKSGTYTMSVVPGQGGFNQAVALLCVGAPLESTCSVSPSSVTPGSATTNVTVTVTTTAPSAIAPHSWRFPPVAPLRPSPRGFWLMAMLLIMGLAWAVREWRHPGVSRRRLGLVTVPAMLLLALAMAGCGSNPPPPPKDPGTPVGTYNLTVTGTAGSLSRPSPATPNLVLVVN